MRLAHYLDPFQQQVQLTGVDLVALQRREGPGLQSLVQQPEPVALPHQHLHPIALAVEEHEHVAGQRVLAQDLLHLGAQPINDRRRSVAPRATKTRTDAD